MVRGSTSREAVPYMEDHSSPLYLHPADNPGTVLVLQLLNGSNYNAWSRSMVPALCAKNKLGFVDGSIPSPDPQDLLYDAWTRCNSMVVSWLRNSETSRDIRLGWVKELRIFMYWRLHILLELLLLSLLAQ